VQSECSDLTATTPRVLGDDLPHPNGRDRDDNADDNDDTADDDAEPVTPRRGTTIA
jgi:hypothetical protein